VPGLTHSVTNATGSAHRLGGTFYPASGADHVRKENGRDIVFFAEPRHQKPFAIGFQHQ
jgi:hypothetical protein